MVVLPVKIVDEILKCGCSNDSYFKNSTFKHHSMNITPFSQGSPIIITKYAITKNMPLITRLIG